MARRTAESPIAEWGLAHTRFPTPGHLAAWAGMCQGNHESTDKRQSGQTRKGNGALRRALVEAVQVAGRSKWTYLGTRFRRLAARRGKWTAVAVGHTILTNVSHLLAAETSYQDVGPQPFDARDRQWVERRLVHRLAALSNKVVLELRQPHIAVAPPLRAPYNVRVATQCVATRIGGCAMFRLTIALLGPPRVECDGQPLRVDTRKAIALVAYLAVTGGRHRRDALATLLWPESDQVGARAALRRTLSTLHTGLAAPWLEADREVVGLRQDAGRWVDIERFRELLAACLAHGHAATGVCRACLPPLAEAVGLYRDDFLAGFTLRDSPAFDDWQARQADGLQRDLAGALDRLVAGHGAAGEFEAAAAYGRRRLALDPLHEPAHRQLMLAYARADQWSHALRQYRECVRILDQELGVSPLTETTALYEAIKEHRLGPPVAPPPMPPQHPAILPAPGAPHRHPHPLVGRAVEWAALRDIYDAIDGDGRVVVLEGEAGIGKTRLADEFLAWAHAGGAASVALRAYDGEAHLAYDPFVDALRSVAGSPTLASRLANVPGRWLGEAARLVPELAEGRADVPPLAPLDSPGAQGRFFEGVDQVLLAACDGPRPGVLVFDDLHWADAASLDLAIYLARRLRGRPLCVLATWRGDRVPPGHRLRHLLAELGRAGVATLVPLPRLSRPATIELVRAAGPALPAALGDRVYQETEGLPFFLTEYLAALARDGASAVGPSPEHGWALPGGVRALLQTRLAGVDETCRQLLQAAAVIGRAFEFDIARAASGRGDEEVLSSLDALVASGLVREVRGGADKRQLAYDFDHEQLRRHVYDEMGQARRRHLHRRVAEALTGRARGEREAGAQAGQVAGHYRLAGREAEAARWFKLAGEHARALYANTEALGHFETALALGHPDAAVLHEAIGDLRTLAGDYGAALASYETAAALAPAAALAAIEHKLGRVQHRRGAWELAEAHFQAAVAALGDGGPPDERARLAADRGLAAHRRGQAAEAAAHARESLALAEAAGDAGALAQAYNLLGIFAGSQGDRAAARGYLEHSLALAERLGDAGARAAALNNLSLVYHADGDFERALPFATAALELCTVLGDRHREAALHNNLADLLHAAGHTAEAMSHLKRAVTIYAEIGVEAGAVQPQIWKLTEW